jgi:hypothetical protein
MAQITCLELLLRSRLCAFGYVHRRLSYFVYTSVVIKYKLQRVYFFFNLSEYFSLLKMIAYLEIKDKCGVYGKPKVKRESLKIQML